MTTIQKTNDKWPHKIVPRLLWQEIVRAEVVQKMTSIYRHFYRHFWRKSQKHRVLDQTPRHRSLIGKGGQSFPLVWFRLTHKGFQRIHSSTNKGNNSAKSSIHFQYTFNTLLFVQYMFYSTFCRPPKSFKYFINYKCNKDVEI